MQEIEVKAKIIDKEKIKSKLINLGCTFTKPQKQKDVIFLPTGISFLEIKKGTPVVRIRNTKERVFLTLKKRLINDNELSTLEKEIVVNDEKETTELIENMGFYEVVRVYKTRQECHHKGLTICVDEIEELGSFIEIEKLSENENSETIQNELLNFLMSLGISPDDRVTKGYDTLVYEKTNKK